MKTVAIIQARMGSSRLPGKVLKDLGGKTVLGRVVSRARRASLFDELLVATSTVPADEEIARECERLNVPCFRGDESDVLDRYYGAAVAAEAQVIIRITSDCPLIDPQIIDDTVRIFVNEHCEYASNVFPRTFPRGLDVEVFGMASLQVAWQEAHSPHEREHVTPYLNQHPERFRQACLQGSKDYSAYRWTLDTSDDLRLLRTIYSRMSDGDGFHWMEVVELMEREPELSKLNSHITQKSLYAH